MRSRYWSCTKFADWIRGTDKIPVGTSSDWNLWEKTSKTIHPVRFWIAEEALDNVQSFFWWPVDQLYSFKYWINNRFVTKTHTLQSRLKKGQWQELDTRFLHCLFDELVNHVEIELAASNFRWDDAARKKYKTPFWACGWFRWRTYRNVDAAMEYLEWASNLRWSENEVGDDDPSLGELTLQAKNAREIRELYLWWKNDYSIRLDPHDASGWTELCERHRGDGVAFFDLAERTEEEQVETRRVLDLCHKLEEEQLQEEEDMLIRLIKIRRGLWT